MWKGLRLMLAGCGLVTLLCAQPVAVIAVSEGSATVTNAGQSPQPAHGLDWLPAGVVLEASRGSRLVVAFSNGHRYELGPGAKVSITAAGPVNHAGPLRELEKLPPMPKLPEINLVSGAAAMGGMRVRDMTVHLVFPHDKLSTLPDHTVLHLQPAEPGTRYKVEVVDPAGSSVYQCETTATTVTVPAGTLKPGQLYVWRVLNTSGEVLGKATFTTVSAETIASRAAFKAAVSESDVESLVLLAAMDAQLGLCDEAHEELRASLARSVHQEAARRLLTVIEDAMR